MEKEILTEEEETEEEVDEETKTLLNDILDTKVAKIEKRFEEALEAEKEKMAKKAGIYNPEVQEKENRKELNTRFKKLMKSVAMGDYASAKDYMKKDHSTTEPSEIVDEQIDFEILHLQEEYGVARQLFRNLQLTKHSYRANELATDVTAYWVDEGDSITASNITITENTLDLLKLAALASFTNELLEDAEVDVVGFITQRVAEVFAEAEDTKFLVDATIGLINVADDSVVRITKTDLGDSTLTDVEVSDKLLDLQGAVSKSVRDRGKYLMSWDVFAKVRKLRDDNEQPLFKHLTEEGPMTIHGKPVVLSDVMPDVSDCDSADDGILMFGDFERGCILGFKGGIRIDRATQGAINPVGSEVNLFQTDRQAVRFIQRTGYAQVLSNTVAVLKTATS